MRYEIEINTDNAAFRPDPGGELHAILADLAFEARNEGDLTERPVVDANGNTVGRVVRVDD